MNDGKGPLVRLANGLYRYTQGHLNEAFEKYGLSSGTYPFLFVLYRNEGINQNQISRELNVDKAMSARAVKNLMALGYLRKEYDKEDSRAYKLFLTEKGRDVVPKLKVELNRWNQIITLGLDEAEKSSIVELMEKVLENAKKHRNKFIENEG